MKALSIKHPWADRIVKGEKTIETRTWESNYRGDILICSSKKADPHFDLKKHKLKYGFALCIVELFKIEKMKVEHEKAAMCNIYPGAFAWHFRNIRLINPFPVKGMLRLLI